MIGNGETDDDGIVATHIDSEDDFIYFLGQQRYSQGRQTVRLKIEQSNTPYNIFFGCISSQAIEKEISFYSPFVAGWFGGDDIYQHGPCFVGAKDHDYKSDNIRTNDVLQLTFNCEEKQIELFQERLNKRLTLSVNINEAPFPWQMLLVLAYQNDRVRIIP
jgi:hypothetical protein